MNKKAEKQTTPEPGAAGQQYLNEYMVMVNRLQVLSKLSVRKFLGTRADNDPRVEFLSDHELFKYLANVNIQVLMELFIKAAGMSREEYLKLQNNVISNQLAELQQFLGVTGWDANEQPLLDLAKYAERTQLWPK